MLRFTPRPEIELTLAAGRQLEHGGVSPLGVLLAAAPADAQGGPGAGAVLVDAPVAHHHAARVHVPHHHLPVGEHTDCQQEALVVGEGHRRHAVVVLLQPVDGDPSLQVPDDHVRVDAPLARRGQPARRRHRQAADRVVVPAQKVLLVGVGQVGQHDRRARHVGAGRAALAQHVQRAHGRAVQTDGVLELDGRAAGSRHGAEGTAAPA
eukprot:scaffold4341_cov101-Isochrysis_galbana.AAC.2